MSERKYRETVERLGGTIDATCVVDFPDTLCIKTKWEALDLLNLIIHANNGKTNFTMNLDTPIKALRKAIGSLPQ